MWLLYIVVVKKEGRGALIKDRCLNMTFMVNVKVHLITLHGNMTLDIRCLGQIKKVINIKKK